MGLSPAPSTAGRFATTIATFCARICRTDSRVHCKNDLNIYIYYEDDDSLYIVPIHSGYISSDTSLGQHHRTINMDGHRHRVVGPSTMAMETELATTNRRGGWVVVVGFKKLT